MPQCIECRRFSFKRAGDTLPKHGFGHCELQPIGVFYPARRDRVCKDLEQEDGLTVAKRRDFLERKK